MRTHISALTLDGLALGTLAPDAAERAQAHLAACAECRRDQQTAAALRDQFARSVFPRGLPRRRPRYWLWLTAPAVAALCWLVIPLRGPPGPRSAPIPALAAKGDAGWAVYGNRDGQTFVVHDGATLVAGDQIRFAVMPERAPYLLVASIDGQGAATIYYPYDGQSSASITGDRIELEGSIVLDDAPGPERIYALLSDQPLAAADVKAALHMVAAGGEEAIRMTRALRVPARTQLSLVFEKGSR
jgi:hypothetical protein